ncbi:MAG: hypothetical protein J6J61_06205, partial [Muribaculaceae bacterium]|nr:hypothetical protein [Muribaculaceae bacterium]
FIVFLPSRRLTVGKDAWICDIAPMRLPISGASRDDRALRRHGVKFLGVEGVSPSDLEDGLQPGREIGAMNSKGFSTILVLGFETRKENPEDE